jgi:NAD(P)H-flavin reductase
MNGPEIPPLVARHGVHHTINIKYGYIVIALSIVYIGSHLLVKHFYFKSWNDSGHPNSRLKRILSLPLWISVVATVLIVICLSVFNIHQFSENYPIVLKRLGRIAYSLIPLTIYLALRPAAITNYQIGYYLETINFHKWVSRTIILCAATHGIGFLVKWTMENTLAKLLILENLYGVSIAILLVVLSIVSIRYFRRSQYQLFYIVHNASVWLMTLIIAFHARPGVSFITFVALMILAVQLFERFGRSFAVSGLQIEQPEGSTLQVITMTRPDNFPHYLPGSHIRINFRGKDLRSWMLPTHPYTIASISDKNVDSLRLIIRQTSNFHLDTISEYSLTGPFPSLPNHFFATAKQVNIICGGSGISFGLPLFEYFKAHGSTSVKLVWCIRNRNDCKILKDFAILGVHIYITEKVSSEGSLFDIEQQHGLLNNTEENEPSVEMTDLTKSENKFIFQGRPNLDEAFSDIGQSETSHTWAIACGPRGLIRSTKDWAQKRNIQFYSEIYEM